jgi:hypothetical protein
MDLSIILSVVAVSISILSAFIAKCSLKSQINVSKNAALVSQTQRNEANLAANTELFSLYNIDLNELKQKGITPEELLYIWSDLRQGEIFHRIEGFTKEDMLSDYRTNLLKNEKVQIAFNDFIFGCLMSKSDYTETLKRYIDSLNMANQ